MNPIDKDALIQELDITDMNCNKCAWHDKYGGCSRGSVFARVCSVIEYAPIIETQKTGKWIRRKDSKGWECSNCHTILESVDLDRHNFYYCYHCGAKMTSMEV